MRQIRRGVFETNSSSTHSITLCAKDDYYKWKSGEVYLNQGSGWCSNSINKDKKFVTKCEAIDILTDSKYPPEKDLNTLGEADLHEFFKENEIYTYENYESDYLEYFEETHITPNGEEIVAFGQFGYDG